MIEKLASFVDFIVVVLKKILFLMFVNIDSINFFVVLQQTRDIFGANSEFILGFRVNWVLFYDLFAHVRVDDVEIPAYFFEELQDIFVGGLGGVDFKGAAIFAFGLVEEEIDN